VLSELRRHADVVVIEAPPVLASADTGPLADLAEMILLVTDARRSTRAQVRTAMAELDAVRGELIGCVLHNVGRRRRLPRPRRLPAPAAYGRAREPVPPPPAGADGHERAARERNGNDVRWPAPSGTGLAGLDETPKGDDR
jgi:tyrosine-protein kinase Etk/Wzc